MKVKFSKENYEFSKVADSLPNGICQNPELTSSLLNISTPQIVLVLFN